MSEERTFTIELEQVDGLEFRVRFDWEEAAELLMDEPEPIGHRAGPNASRLLAAAVGNCLTASLLFCLRRSKLDLKGTRTRVTGTIDRSEQGRLRVGGFDVRIELPVGAAEKAQLDRCLGLFEDYCVVTASVRRGIPVRVRVVDNAGAPLFQDGGS